MTISTYAELQAAVGNWLARSDLTARIPEFIAMCEAQMNRKLRVTRMLQRDIATISTDNRYSTVPSDFLEVKSYVVSNGTSSELLTPVTAEVIAAYRVARDTPATPRFYSISGTASGGRDFEHYPTPDQDYTGTLTFYAKIPALSATNTTNWVLNDAPDAYLYGALLQAAPYLRDADQAPVWNAGFQAALDGISAMERTDGGLLRTDVGLTDRRRIGAYDITRDF